MNDYDPVYEHGYAHYQHRQQSDTFSITQAAVTLILLGVAASLVFNISPQEAAGKVLNVACKMATRIGSRLFGHPLGGFTGSGGEGSALKSVFGVDTGLLKKFDSRGLGTYLSGGKSDKPPGLGNMNNSCYQNSVIQGLASIRSLPNFLADVSSRDMAPSSMNAALLETLEKLNSSANNGRQLWLPSTLKTMSTWQQQDAQEYFSKVLDQVDKEAIRASEERTSNLPSLGHISSTAETSVANSTSTFSSPGNPLEGLLAQRVGCLSCRYSEGLSLIPFNNLTVPLGNASVCDVRDCLDEYSKLEAIEGVQCPKCTLLRQQEKLKQLLSKGIPESLVEDVRNRVRIIDEALQEEDFSDNTLVKRCQIPKKQWASSTKSKQVVIARAPQAFVIHVNRSMFNEYTGAQLKNFATVRFPLFMDLANWCLGTTTASEKGDTMTENWSMDPAESMLPDPEYLSVDDEGSLSTNKYELRALVTHFGRHENGHYVCYRKLPYIDTASSDLDSLDEEPHNESREAWWRLSDEDVSRVTENHVLSQGGVFMLFYERVDNSSATTLQPPEAAEEDSKTKAKLGEAVLNEAVHVPRPADSEDESDEEIRKTVPSILYPDTLLVERNAPTLAELIEAARIPLPEDPDEFSDSPTDSTFDTEESEDLHPSNTTGYMTAPPAERIRMRTSSAFATSSSGAEDPLQSPIRMGTAF